MTYKIELVTYSVGWEEAFKAEKARLRYVLAHQIARIHHVGSTAILGIKAKPIIDIAVESPQYPPDHDTIGILGSMGYRRRGESGVPGRQWFTKGEPRTHHLHWCPLNGEVVLKQSAFVRVLNSDRELVREYEALKVDLAIRFPYDHDAYALGKAAFVERVVRETRAGES